MEAVKVWGFSMCAAVVIGSIVSMLVPSLEKQRVVKLAISAFILIGMLSPVLNIIDEVDFSVSVFEQINYTEYKDDKLDENILDDLENSVSQSLFPLIEQQFIDLKQSAEIGVDTDLSQSSDGICIENVNITVTELHKIEKDALKKILEENIGLPISINVAKYKE